MCMPPCKVCLVTHQRRNLISVGWLEHKAQWCQNISFFPIESTCFAIRPGSFYPKQYTNQQACYLLRGDIENDQIKELKQTKIVSVHFLVNSAGALASSHNSQREVLPKSLCTTNIVLRSELYVLTVGSSWGQ